MTLQRLTVWTVALAMVEELLSPMWRRRNPVRPAHMGRAIDDTQDRSSSCIVCLRSSSDVLCSARCLVLWSWRRNQNLSCADCQATLTQSAQVNRHGHVVCGRCYAGSRTETREMSCSVPGCNRPWRLHRGEWQSECPRCTYRSTAINRHPLAGSRIERVVFDD